MCEEYAPSLPVSRLLGRISFVDSLGCVKDAASDNIQEIIYLGASLMQNDASVCGGIMELIFFGEGLI